MLDDFIPLSIMQHCNKSAALCGKDGQLMALELIPKVLRMRSIQTSAKDELCLPSRSHGRSGKEMREGEKRQLHKKKGDRS